MELEPSACYRALRTRDARFDGRFFTGVRSTGVFCRPVCPARTPRRENCVFFACAAAAQEAGFRPCLRCRPEASPGTPAWLGTSTSVSRAMRLITQGALDAGRVDDLARRLGIGERHLRRLFVEHLGASPLAVAQSRRILFAKKLIDETALPMAEVALAAGFASVRRFNDAVLKTYGRSPRLLRRARRGDGNGGRSGEVRLKLPFRAPYDWDAMLRFLDLRATPGVESARSGAYRRSVSIDGVQGLVEVRAVRGEKHLLARIRLSSAAPLIQVAERLRRIFDLGADPHEIASHLRRDPRLAPLVRARPGLRIPGAWEGFELAVRAILGQQVSVKGATTLAGRLVQTYGEPLALDPREAEDESLRFLFPEPEALAGADLSALGLPRSRAAAISCLASAVARKELLLDAVGDLEETLQRLRALPGVGDWTAQYIAMRALREPDAFPATDLGLRRALAEDGEPASASEVARRAESWRPWRAYAAIHLWTSPAASKATRRKQRAASHR